jgi:hypothetical protein
MSFVRSLRVSLALAAVTLCSIAQADLPDLRGQTFYLTGGVTATGQALGNDLGALVPPTGLPVEFDNPFRLTIQNSGPADNSALTGTLAFPLLGNCVNPVIGPLTGSFNRTTGAFTMSGATSGYSVVDFGTNNFGGAIGNRRILVRFENLGITLTGTGSVDSDGVFRLKNPGSNAFQFTISGTEPRVSLVATNSCTFVDVGFFQGPVSNAALGLLNWEARQPTARGTLALGVVDTAAARPIQFDFRTPGTLTTLFSKIISVGPSGAYFLPNINPGTYDVSILGTGTDGSSYLRRSKANESFTADRTGLDAALISGDVILDNTIDLFDLVTFFESYGTSSGESNYNPNADLNGDGITDLFDLIDFFTNYGSTGDN